MKDRAGNGQDTNVKVTRNSERQSREWTRHQYKDDTKQSKTEQIIDKTPIQRCKQIVKDRAQNGQYTNVKVTTKDKAIAENGQDTNIKVTRKDKAIAENGQDTNIKVTTIDKVKKWRANITQVLFWEK